MTKTEKQKAAMKRWRAAHPTYCQEWRAKNKARHQKNQRENRHGSIQRYPEPKHCECCGIVMLATKKGPQFDHDHTTGFHRGWLCNACNNGIARLGDTIEGVERALVYLKRVQDQELLP